MSKNIYIIFDKNKNCLGWSRKKLNLVVLHPTPEEMRKRKAVTQYLDVDSVIPSEVLKYTSTWIHEFKAKNKEIK